MMRSKLKWKGVRARKMFGVGVEGWGRGSSRVGGRGRGVPMSEGGRRGGGARCRKLLMACRSADLGSGPGHPTPLVSWIPSRPSFVLCQDTEAPSTAGALGGRNLERRKSTRGSNGELIFKSDDTGNLMPIEEDLAP